MEATSPSGSGALPLDILPMASRRSTGYVHPTMAEDLDLLQLLLRPAIVAAVDDLGLDSLGVEDVLTALRRFGAVRVEVGDTYTCVLEVPDEPAERAEGPTV